MSKESYIRGFCKAAAAAGVNPVALAKYAQQYKTEGYSPISDEPFDGEVKIPKVYPEGDVNSSRPPYGWSLLHPRDMQELPSTPSEKVRQILNPRHLAWHQAHTNALTKATAPLRSADFPATYKIPEDIGDMLSKLYHDEMKRTTSAPPVQVRAPVKK
jgi:hypothetical protein